MKFDCTLSIADIVGRDTIKIHRWLDNNGEIGCIENCNSPSNAAAAAANPADFYSSSASSSPKSSNSSLAASNSSPKNIKSPPKEEKVAPKEIDQRKLLQKFSRMQLTSTIQRDQASVNTSDSAPSLDSAQSLQKIQTKPRMTPHSTQSSSSGQSKMADQTKPLIQSKQSTPSIISTTSTPASDTQSLPLAQIEEARLVSCNFFLKNFTKCRVKIDFIKFIHHIQIDHHLYYNNMHETNHGIVCKMFN